MRYTPAALALAALVAIQSSVGMAAQEPADPRAAALVTQGEASLAAGETQSAIDAFEAALVIDPAYSDAYVHLADVARAEGLQGKAIHYYRMVLEREPRNFTAMAGEGAALAEKGATERARRTLAQLESLCGADCAETRELAALIEAGPAEPVLAAEDVMPDMTVQQN